MESAIRRATGLLTIPAQADARPGKTRIEVRAGMADSVVVSGTCCNFDAVRR